MFDTEKNAYVALGNNEGMVRYFGEYRHEESRSTNSLSPNASKMSLLASDKVRITITYNMLLEFGELDLDNFFAEVLPPVIQSEIEDFWMNLTGIADALESIHNLREETNGRSQEYYGSVTGGLTLLFNSNKLLGGMLILSLIISSSSKENLSCLTQALLTSSELGGQALIKLQL